MALKFDLEDFFHSTEANYVKPEDLEGDTSSDDEDD